MPPLLLCDQWTESLNSYYKEVLRAIGTDDLDVQQEVEGKGKGLVATKAISEGETVFVERPLVSLQHLDNKDGALVCDECLRFIGSVEGQIGFKLQRLVDTLRKSQHADVSQQQAGEDSEDAEEHQDVDLDAALEAGERLEQIYSHVTPEQITGLSTGAVTLPMTEDFKLPAPIPCRRGCGALYCSASCEAQSWEHHHCLLCTAAAPDAEASTSAGPAQETAATSAAANVAASAAAPDASAATPEEPRPGPPTAADSGDQCSTDGAGPSAAGASQAAAALPATPAEQLAEDGGPHAQSGNGGGTSGSAAAAGPSVSGAAPAVAATEELLGIRVDRTALRAFTEHARSTNEIFLLAAQVVAATLLRAARLLAGEAGRCMQGAVPAGCLQGEAADGAGPSAMGGAGAEAEAAAIGGGGGGSDGGDACRSALLVAWRPYMYGWKRCWWESVAVPDDVDDEGEFRQQLRDLASDSLELLSAAISDPRFGPDLLQLEVYGSIVGMFELNNLGLTISSPVEDYFLAVDEMEEGAEKMAVLKVTQPLLDALDTEYATPCEATAFMALQSCINHSCDPNCTAACDNGDRTVTVLAQRDIAAGEEITLSYIDVSLPYKDRQAELRDYGFVCRCSRCTTEAAAARAKRQAAAGKGVKVGSRRR